MISAEELTARLQSQANRNTYILCASFEDRCKRLARILTSAASDHKKNRLFCISLPDENVLPVLISRRASVRREIESLISPEFISASESVRTISVLAQSNPTENVVIDASGMPRRLLYDMLEVLAASRPHFDDIYLVYNYPHQYLPGTLEITSPLMSFLYPSPALQNDQRIHLVLFPGFNTTETVVALSRVFDPCIQNYDIRIHWVFVHPGTHYGDYERSIGEHIIFREQIRQAAHKFWISKANDFGSIGSMIFNFSEEMSGNDVMVLAGLGPRIVSVPILLSARALRSMNRWTNVLIPTPLFYSSLRSEGEGVDCSAWDLSAEYANMTRKAGAK